MKNLVNIMLSLIVALLVVSCDNKPTKTIVGEDGKTYEVINDSSPQLMQDLGNGVQDFGNGVYYFTYNQVKFAQALSEFIGQHPELKFVSATGNGTGSSAGGYEWGRDKGYFVVFEKRETP